MDFAIKICLIVFWGLLGLSSANGQSVVIDGSMVSTNGLPIIYKDYTAELRSDDSVLLEKQRVNTAGNFTFQLKFAHDYYISVYNKTETVWRLLVHNKMEFGMVHYPVTVEIPARPKDKDVYEVTFDKEGNKLYLKNGLPISEITYQFETGRRDSSEIIKK
jgi:hypothetical protein